MVLARLGRRGETPKDLAIASAFRRNWIDAEERADVREGESRRDGDLVERVARSMGSTHKLEELLKTVWGSGSANFCGRRVSDAP